MIESEDRKTLVPFDLSNILDQVPELKKLNVKLDSESFEKPIDSSDMQPKDWARMAQIIERHYDRYDGFVILHGSDTLAYSASALSFMLEGLKKPVILTGSQLPIGMIRTDARENLITAVEMAAMQENGAPVIQEVAIYFEYKLYRGNRTCKVSAEAFEAFSSPNYPLLAEAGVHIAVNHNRLFKSTQDAFKMHSKLDASVGVLTLFPGMSEEQLLAQLGSKNQRALIFQTFGSGNASQQPWFLKALKTAIENGLIVLNVTQCMKGKVEQGKYATSKALLDMGVIGGSDLTLEAAITKMMFLLGQSADTNWIKTQLIANIRGELSVS
jgi:L-asparaginase